MAISRVLFVAVLSVSARAWSLDNQFPEAVSPEGTIAKTRAQRQMRQSPAPADGVDHSEGAELLRKIPHRILWPKLKYSKRYSSLILWAWHPVFHYDEKRQNARTRGVRLSNGDIVDRDSRKLLVVMYNDRQYFFDGVNSEESRISREEMGGFYSFNPKSGKVYLLIMPTDPQKRAEGPVIHVVLELREAFPHFSGWGGEVVYEEGVYVVETKSLNGLQFERAEYTIFPQALWDRDGGNPILFDPKKFATGLDMIVVPEKSAR